MKKTAFIILALGIGLAITILPSAIDKRVNHFDTSNTPPSPLHQDLFIADMHGDVLLWDRDILKRYSYGHEDLPRMQQGNMALQVFSAVTHSPVGQNFQNNSGRYNRVAALVAAQGWPPRTWNSALQRALYQADKLKQAAADSKGQLRLIQNRGDLFALHFDRVYRPELLGGLLSIEGAQALDGDLDHLDTLYNAGYRMIGLSHFFDNQFAGSAHGEERYGLTADGKALIQAMSTKHMLIDLAHASPRLIEDVLLHSAGPLFVSHTGVKGTCHSPRNLSDDQLMRIGSRGGLIGIAFFPGAVCGNTVEHIVAAIQHAVSIAGVDAIALGSDFDGAVSTPFDVTGLSALTAALQEAGLSDGDIRKIMGGNMLRVLAQTLPPNPQLEQPIDDWGDASQFVF